MLRYIINLGFVFTVLQLTAQSARIDSRLLASDDVQPFYVSYEQKPSFASIDPAWNKERKGQAVYDLLRQEADASQEELKQLLAARGIDYRSFFITNMVYVSGGDKSLIREIANLKGVSRITAQSVFMAENVQAEAFIGFRDSTYVDWGILKIGADKVWEMGIHGEGAVVAGGDTGYDWEHPALRSKYRGYRAESDTADHNYNWHDAIHQISPLHGDSVPLPELNPCGLDVRYPCDDNRHGTHTMGTMVGEDTINKIGVAPGARWMACRNMERGYGSPLTYLECFEFFLAPTDLQGLNPDPSLAPHVINNSWSCPEIEGCDTSNFFLLQQAVDHLKAAGIVVVVSAGNSGSRGCESVSTPAAIFENSFTVGATRSNDTIAGFSSRGPVRVDGSGRMKPNVSAPGVSVLSSILDGRYARFSGTSMAGPHVAGAVALMISANPSIAGHVEEIESILEQTAVYTIDSMCTEADSLWYRNNTYGYGRIDVYEAVLRAMDFVSTTQEAQDILPLEIYPNPFHRQLTISSPYPLLSGRMIWTDISGRTVLNSRVQFFQGPNNIELPRSDQPTARLLLYRFIEDKGKVFSGKIIQW